MSKPTSVILIVFALTLMTFFFSLYPPTTNDPPRSFDQTPDSGIIEDNDGQQLLQLELQKLFEQIVDSSRRSTQVPNHADRKQPDGPASGEQAAGPQPDLTQQMLHAGVPEDIIDQLMQRVERNRFSLLELRQQATREGWIDSPEYKEKSGISGNPTRGVRELFGDRVFDLYLYFSGNPNRVQLKRVASGSTEEYAGLMAGDVITRYASGNIYSIFELQRAIQKGEVGETILIEFLRDGQPLFTTAPRGPLRSSLGMIRLHPDG